MTWPGSTRHRRLPSAWDRTRARILKRDHGICHVCHRRGADEVDHLDAGDDHRDSNLAAIHNDPCHAQKSAAEGAASARGGAQAAARRALLPHASTSRPAERHPGLR